MKTRDVALGVALGLLAYDGLVILIKVSVMVFLSAVAGAIVK